MMETWGQKIRRMRRDEELERSAASQKASEDFKQAIKRNNEKNPVDPDWPEIIGDEQSS